MSIIDKIEEKMNFKSSIACYIYVCKLIFDKFDYIVE